MSPVANIKDIGKGSESGTPDQDHAPLRRTRTPSDLKWTVNELAAVKGEIEHIDQEVARLKQRRERLMRMAKALSAVTQLIAAEVHPAAVEPVHAHTRYGGRGNLRKYLRETLKAAHPGAVPTSVLADGAEQVFGLRFSSCQERARFADNNLGNALRRMCARGEVERLHDYAGLPTMSGVWRWKTPTPSLDELRKDEAMAGQLREDGSWR